MTHGTGQLKPLEDRVNLHQQRHRNQKIAARRIVAAQLQGQINLARGMFAEFYLMGPWARLRWLVLGGRYHNRRGSYLLAALLGLLALGGVLAYVS